MHPAAADNAPMAPGSATTLALEVEALTVALVGRRGQIPVVTGAGLALARREILGVVGESGSGKSTDEPGDYAPARHEERPDRRGLGASVRTRPAQLCPSGRCAPCGAGRSG